MFGVFDSTHSYLSDEFSIAIEEKNGILFYKRNIADKIVEKSIIISGKQKIFITPVEPVNTPKFLSPYLLIELEKPVLIAPKKTQKLFLLFPVEIGVFLESENDTKVIDCFSLTKQKYTLYGDPHNGLICKYYKSTVFYERPEYIECKQGILQLTISNSNLEWAEVTKVVFDVSGMKLFYKGTKVISSATLSIRLGGIVETEFSEDTSEVNMQKAIELYPVNKLRIGSIKFNMEYGI